MAQRHRLSLLVRILIVGAATMTALTVVLLVLYSRDARTQAVDGYREKARAICLTAESTREEMEHKWRQGLFSAEDLRTWADEGRNDLVLSAVPVVTAWRAAMARAEEGGYEFRVPKISPRNPANTPDKAFEPPALRYLKKHSGERRPPAGFVAATASASLRLLSDGPASPSSPRLASTAAATNQMAEMIVERVLTRSRRYSRFHCPRHRRHVRQGR